MEREPFNLVSYLERGQRPTIPNNVNENWARVMKDCWQQLPQDRPKMIDVVKDIRDNIEDYYPEGVDRDTEEAQEIDDYLKLVLEGLDL